MQSTSGKAAVDATNPRNTGSRPSNAKLWRSLDSSAKICAASAGVRPKPEAVDGGNRPSDGSAGKGDRTLATAKQLSGMGRAPTFIVSRIPVQGEEIATSRAETGMSTAERQIGQSANGSTMMRLISPVHGAKEDIPCRRSVTSSCEPKRSMAARIMPQLASSGASRASREGAAGYAPFIQFVTEA